MLGIQIAYRRAPYKKLSSSLLVAENQQVADFCKWRICSYSNSFFAGKRRAPPLFWRACRRAPMLNPCACVFDSNTCWNFQIHFFVGGRPSTKEDTCVFDTFLAEIFLLVRLQEGATISPIRACSVHSFSATNLVLVLASFEVYLFVSILFFVQKSATYFIILWANCMWSIAINYAHIFSFMVAAHWVDFVLENLFPIYYKLIFLLWLKNRSQSVLYLMKIGWMAQTILCGATWLRTFLLQKVYGK